MRSLRRGEKRIVGEKNNGNKRKGKTQQLHGGESFLKIKETNEGNIEIAHHVPEDIHDGHGFVVEGLEKDEGLEGVDKHAERDGDTVGMVARTVFF